MRSRSLLWTFGAVMAFVSAGYGVLFSMTDDYHDDHGISETALGAVIGIGFVAGFVAQLAIAPLADRGHARQLVLCGMATTIAGLLLMAVSTSVWPLLAGRFVMGVGVGMVEPAVRRIVIVADPDRLGDHLGRLFAAAVGGFACGPAVSALLVDPFGIAAPFLVIAAGTLVLLPIVARTPVQEEVAPASQRLALDLLRIRPFAAAVVLSCAVWLMIGAFDALWSLVLDDLETNEWIANLGITMFAVPLVVLGAAGGRLAQRVGPFRVGTVGLLLGAGFLVLYGLVPTGGAMFAVAMVHALSDGLTVSSAGVAAGLAVPHDRQAGAQGVLGGCSTLTAGLTAFVAGTLYEHAGRTVTYAAAGAAMVVLVIVALALAGPSWRLRGALTEPSPGLEGALH